MEVFYTVHKNNLENKTATLDLQLKAAKKKTAKHKSSVQTCSVTLILNKKSNQH